MDRSEKQMAAHCQKQMDQMHIAFSAKINSLSMQQKNQIHHLLDR